MKYIYTKDKCSACIELKDKYYNEGTEYIERDADRLQNPGNDVDEIDKIAFAKLADNNEGMVFPVEVEV